VVDMRKKIIKMIKTWMYDDEVNNDDDDDDDDRICIIFVIL
jgi:hypothetical protein